MTTPTQRPVWGADVPVSMPQPAPEPIVVPMFGFGMTQYRLVHNLTQREYEALSVPVFQPRDPSQTAVNDSAAIDAAGVPRGTP